jgi:hypothetical protein
MRHPWVMPSLKRKLSTPTDSSDSDSPSPFTQKRRRCEVLENGFAHLTLSHTTLPASSGLPIRGIITEPTFRAESNTSHQAGQHDPQIYAIPRSDSDADMMVPDIVFPSSVEEPVLPEHHVPEAAMSSESWYKHDKDSQSISNSHAHARLSAPRPGVVVTDLSFDDEEQDVDDLKRKGDGDFEISQALLKRLKSPVHPFALPSKADDSQALVLFRPLLVSAQPTVDALELETTARIEELPEDTSADLVGDMYCDAQDDDAMEIED